jgi:proteasome lid subunit RPN8/RPN11
MALHLSSSDWRQLLDWADSAGNHECCGLLRGEGDRVAAVQLTQNVAADPTRHFEIDPAALFSTNKDVRSGGIPVLGYFHSHPNGVAVPSATDIAQAAPDGHIWLIIAAGTITAWQPVVADTQVTGFTPVVLIVEG